MRKVSSDKSSRPVQWIAMRNEADCWIAASAMAAGVPYEEAEKAFGSGADYSAALLGETDDTHVRRISRLFLFLQQYAFFTDHACYPHEQARTKRTDLAQHLAPVRIADSAIPSRCSPLFEQVGIASPVRYSLGAIPPGAYFSFHVEYEDHRAGWQASSRCRTANRRRARGYAFHRWNRGLLRNAGRVSRDVGQIQYNC